MNKFFLEILALDKTLYWGNAATVTVKAIDGDLQVLPGHIPYVNVLPAGVIVMQTEENSRLEFKHTGGMIEVARDKTSILVESGEALGR
jgi:F-type H+-transporting ATPase subunit epsilon